MLFQRDVSRNNIVVDGDYSTNNDYSIDDKARNGDIKKTVMVILAMIIRVILIIVVVILRVA